MNDIVEKILIGIICLFIGWFGGAMMMALAASSKRRDEHAEWCTRNEHTDDETSSTRD